MNTCRFCGIPLHYKEDGSGWIENDKPNCPGNPSGPTFGHSTNSKAVKINSFYEEELKIDFIKIEKNWQS